VRQSFSHGRSKQVVVEKVKRRVIGAPAEAKAESAAAEPAPKRPAAKAAEPRPAERQPAQAAPKSGVVLRTLTEDERTARASALADARVREAEERKIAEEEARRRQSREVVDRADREAAEARKRDEDDRHRREEDAKRKAEQEAKKRFGEDQRAPVPGRHSKPKRTRTAQSASAAQARTSRRCSAADEAYRSKAARAPDTGHGLEHRRSARALGRVVPPPDPAAQRPCQRRTEGKAHSRSDHSGNHHDPGAREPHVGARRGRYPAADEQGHMATINDTIDADTAQLIAEELGHSVKRVAESDVEEGLFSAEGADDASTLLPRPPVVTIMGHVDHGKTSLLDAIRSTQVAAGEAGGITQHIGAYQVTSPSHGKITFIDTPGHAAFTAMRARGAKVTDIVVLVVAADDGVMPQTVEAIQHAKAAKVPMIVAINKMDKPDAKPERVRTELLQHEIQVETLGGEVLDVEVSATKKLNLERLLETIGLQAEILELKANPQRPAEGTVIEAKLDRGRGPVATVLVQRGTLKPGDIVVAGAEYGRVRALVSDTGIPVIVAGPSTPVEVLGFNGTPEAGDRLAVVDNEARAREVTDYRARQKREKSSARATGVRGSLEQMMAQAKTAGRKEFPLLIKGDVQGSIEAIIGSLEKLGTTEVGARVIHRGVGGITESDVTLAESLGVRDHRLQRARPQGSARGRRAAGIEIRYYNIIYNLVDDVKKAMSGLLAPTLRETMLGNAQILEIFTVSKVGKIAGCRVTDGTVERGANVRLIRDNVVIHEGKLSQLKRFKDDAREVAAGQECGMAFENYRTCASAT
jgi:translation initiation factor IF-2